MNRLLRTLTHVAWLGALACGSPPAALREVAPAPRGSLGALCEEVLRDPAAPAALGELLEAWTRARHSSPAPPCEGRIVFADSAASDFAPDYFDALAPASRFATRELPRHTRAGAGAALVGIRRNRVLDPIERHYPPEAIARAVTALAEHERDADGVARVRVRLLSSLQHEDALVGGVRVPLAADFTVAFAALLGRTEALSHAWISGLIAKHPPREAQLYLMEPYDPRKVPVLLVHGLASTPLTWAPLTNAIWGDAALRQRYQVWHYLYPTSPPFLYSAQRMRERLDEVRALLAAQGFAEPLPLVVVAHSMGGLLAKTLITDPGEAVWQTVFTRPHEALRGAPADLAATRDILHWQPRAHVRRVIFLAVPHRGSELAQRVAGRLGDALAETPPEFVALYARVDAANPGAFTPAFERAFSRAGFTSIDTLSPRHPLLPVLDALPFAPWVTVHSVIGDRGERVPREASSDGVVPYSSSHLSAAASETIVHAAHALPAHPDAIAEVLRLLALP